MISESSRGGQVLKIGYLCPALGGIRFVIFMIVFFINDPPEAALKYSILVRLWRIQSTIFNYFKLVKISIYNFLATKCTKIAAKD